MRQYCSNTSLGELPLDPQVNSVESQTVNSHMVTTVGRNETTNATMGRPAKAYYHMVTGECDTRGITTSGVNSHIVTGQRDNRGPTASQRRDSHTVSGAANPHGTAASRTVLGRQKSQTTTNSQPQQMTAPVSTERHGVTTGNNNESTRSNPIDQLAHAIERIAANKQPNTTSLLKPVTASTLIFDGKNEKFELFEDLFHTMLKMQPEMTEAMKINHFHSLLRKEALQTFKNIQSTSRTTLEEILVIFRRKYVKPQSVATAKHKWHRLMFNPSEQSLPDFLEELHQTAERAFGDQAQGMTDSLLYAKMPPSLKKSINQAYLEDGTYEQIIKHIEREMELNGLEQGDDLPVATMSATSQQSGENKETRKRMSQMVTQPKNVVTIVRRTVTCVMSATS